MGINMTTADVAMTLIRLGFSLKTVGLFLSTPIIIKLVSLYNSRCTEKNYLNINEVIEELINKELENRKKSLEKEVIDFVAILKPNFTDYDFKEAIKDDKNLSEVDRSAKNIHLLEIYRRVNNISKTFKNITHMTSYNRISHALGPTMTNTLLMTLKDMKMDDDKSIGEELKEFLYTNPLISSFRKNSYHLNSILLEKNLIQGNQQFRGSFLYLYKALGYMNESIATNFMNFFMSYYMNIENPVFDNGYKNRLYYAEQFPVDFNEIKVKYADNPLIKAISIDTQRNGVTVLNLDVRGMSKDRTDELKGAWEDLYEKDPKLAFQLVEYNYFRGSFGFSPKTFLQLMPNTLKTKLPNYIENLSNNEIDIESHIAKMTIQFMLNNNLGRYYDLSKEDITTQEDSFGRKYFLAPIYTSTPTIIKFKAPNGKVYTGYSKRRDKFSSIVQIVEALGGRGNSFEIDPNTYFPTTIWTEINERIEAKKS